MQIDPYCQRQKCSPGIAVSSEIKFMRIFAGVRWPGASDESGVVKNGDFRYFTCYVFRTSTSKDTIIILCHVVPYWLFSDIEIDVLE